MKFTRCSSRPQSTGARVAIVGAGPAGLAAAGELACRGHEVHVMDRLPEPGGMLLFVIPDFRFRKDMVRSGIKELERLGVVFERSEIDSGRLRRLLADYDAVLLSTGAWRNVKLGVRGEELQGVYYGLDWMHMYMLHNLGYGPPPPRPGERTIVVGAGLTGLDVCETLNRVYGLKPVLVYRRPLKVAPAAVALARLAEKGVISVVDSSLPLEVVGANRVEGLKIVSVEPTLDRTAPIKPIPGSERVIEADTVIIAAGIQPSPPPSLAELGVTVERDGRVRVDERFMTNVEGLFAAGDVAHGASNVAKAMESGRRAAASIDEYLRAKR
ncbi:MAG: FAD-dependent oxidoreductase [Thermofilaceae archaeon]